MLGNPASATAIAFILMSIGIFMMIPKIGESLESFLAGKGFAGTAIGEALGPFGTLGKTASGMATGMAERELATPATVAAINAAIKKFKIDPSTGIGAILQGYVNSKNQDKSSTSPVKAPGQRPAR
jgi:hypothetical protein